MCGRFALDVHGDSVFSSFDWLDHARSDEVRSSWASKPNIAPTDEALVVADLLALSLYDERLRPQLADYYTEAAQQIKAYLEPNLIDLGIESRVPMSILPRLVLGLLDGLVMQSFVDPDSLSPEDVVTAIETLAMSLLKAPESTK